MRRTKSGKMPLRYFDGPTMTSYQVPSKASENIYCRNSEEPEECNSHRGFCSTDTFVPISDFEVKISGVGDMAGRGLFAKQDIPSDAYIATEQAINAVHAGPSVWSVINATRDKANDDQMIHAKEELLGLTTYLEGYGFMSKYLVSEMITYSENIVCIKTASLCLVFFTISHLAFSTRSSLKKGKPGWVVDSSQNTFVNHGCNGTYNTGSQEPKWSEMDVDTEEVPEEYLWVTDTYSPVFERRKRQAMSSGVILA